MTRRFVHESYDFQEKLLKPGIYPRAWNVLHEGLQQEVASAFVVGFWRRERPGEIRVGSLGDRRRVPSVQPLFSQTAFDLASLTKIYGTATLVALLVDRGWVRWDHSVRHFFPDYPYADIQLRHLLAHTSGLPAWCPFYESLRNQFAPNPLETVSVLERQKAMRALVLGVRPIAELERQCVYSDIGSLILGFVLEEALSCPFDQAVEKYLWAPMGIRNSFFNRTVQSASAGKLLDVAATEKCPWRGSVLQGQVHDDNAWAMGGYGGHAGAFGPIHDLLQFSKRLMMDNFLSQKVLQTMWAPVMNPSGCEKTLGWDRLSAKGSSAGSRFSRRTVGHLGFTGTSLWIDLEAGIAVAVLTNRVHPSRENNRIRDFRPQIHDALRIDIEERKALNEYVPSAQ